MYSKLKNYMGTIVGKYNGPWKFIILTDESNPNKQHKISVKNDVLRSSLYGENGSDGETTTSTSERIEQISNEISIAESRTIGIEREAVDVDA